ncbi:MAG: hypothetical protein WCY62_02135 [Clostridia bacterium]
MFTKYALNPVVPRTKDTFYSKYAANPDILEFNDKLFFYFRGQGVENHDQMGVSTCTKEAFNGITWDYTCKEPIIKVGVKPSDYDSSYILDPASAVINGKIYLYYSAHSKEIPHSVALAISDNGIDFVKYGSNPIIHNAVVPEVVIKDGRVYLFYQRWTEGSKGISKFYVCTSTNGIDFDVSKERLVFEPEGDCHSISTNRIFYENGIYYSFFGSNRIFKDYPETIGISRSSDLLHWEKSDKTIIERGAPGEWDEGALWFATVYRHKNTYYLWYEGTGTSNHRIDKEAIAASDKAINEDYGGYGKTSFSQIGMATYNGKLSDFFK